MCLVIHNKVDYPAQSSVLDFKMLKLTSNVSGLPYSHWIMSRDRFFWGRGRESLDVRRKCEILSVKWGWWNDWYIIWRREVKRGSWIKNRASSSRVSFFFLCPLPRLKSRIKTWNCEVAWCVLQNAVEDLWDWSFRSFTYADIDVYIQLGSTQIIYLIEAIVSHG